MLQRESGQIRVSVIGSDKYYLQNECDLVLVSAYFLLILNCALFFFFLIPFRLLFADFKHVRVSEAYRCWVSNFHSMNGGDISM